MRGWGRLLRLSLGPSAAADVAAGIVLATGTWPRGAAPVLLILASLCVYHGALALNDWADRERDSVQRPERPLPSGAIAPGAARTAALLLLAAGPLLAALAAPRAGALELGIALLAAGYDLRGRGPWLGPALLGLCRAANLGAGLVLFPVPAGDPRLLLPVAYGLYVFLVSRLGRLEDAEDRLEERRLHPRWLAAGAALLLVAPAALQVALRPGTGTPLALAAAALVGGLGTGGLLGRALASPDWTPRAIQGVMGMALRRLLVFTAAVSLLPGTAAAWIVALVILGGYPLSFLLRRAFPPS